MKTLSLFPRKTAQPPLVGKTARTWTSMTVLFIRANRIRPVTKNKGGSALSPLSLRNRARAPARARFFFIAEHDHEHEQEHEHERSGRISDFVMRTCMCAALIDYALCG